MSRILLVGLPDRPHSTEIVRSLHDHSYSVVTVDRAPPRWHGTVVEASIAVPSFGYEDVLQAARQADRDRPIDGIGLFHENWVEVSTLVAAELGLPHLPTVQVAGCHDKHRMRCWMRAAGVHCPDFAAADDLGSALRAVAELGYPVVVKPQSGGASYGVTRVDDEAGLRAFFDHVDIFWHPRRFLLERYLPGAEVSLETVVDDDPTHLTLFEKPQVLEGPYFLEHTYVAPGRHEERTVRAVEAVVGDMVRRLGLRRVILHTELRLTPEGPMVIEFGARPIGWPGPECVRQVTGVDELLVMAQLACGQSLDLRRAPLAGASGWRYLTVDRPGRVRAVTGYEQILRLPGLLSESCWAEPGSEVGLPPEDFNYIKGFVAVAGDSPQEVAKVLASVDVQLQVDHVERVG
ncbi:MAG: ATP-grasp domain-containing protein [Mycobacteriales bacterium]